MYSLAHTPTHTSTYKCRDRHYMSNQTIIIYCQSGPVKIHSTNRASSPAHLCRHNSIPWSSVLCSLQEWMCLLCLPDLSHSRAFSRPLQWGFKGFCACFNQFRHVRQVSAVEVPANYTIWLLQWARQEADCRQRENPDLNRTRGT